MRKRLPFLMAILLLVMAAGCGSKSADVDAAGQKEPGAAEQSGGKTEQAAHPESAPDLMGKVKTISGDKLTVYKVNMPNNGKPPEGEDRPSGDGTKPPGEGTAKPPENGTKPQGDGKMQPGQPGEPGLRERSQRSAEMFQATDETIALTIPDGATIVQDQGFGENRETDKIDIGSIKEGDLVRIWYGDKLSDGGQSVQYIQVLRFKE